MSQKQYKIDAVLDLILIRYVYKELDHEFTVQNLIKDPRYASRLKDPPGKSKGDTINTAASNVVIWMQDFGLLFNTGSKKNHGGPKRRTYRINRPLFDLLHLHADMWGIPLFVVVKGYYNNSRSYFRKEIGGDRESKEENE